MQKESYGDNKYCSTFTYAHKKPNLYSEAFDWKT